MMVLLMVPVPVVLLVLLVLVVVLLMPAFAESEQFWGGCSERQPCHVLSLDPVHMPLGSPPWILAHKARIQWDPLGSWPGGGHGQPMLLH